MEITLKIKIDVNVLFGAIGFISSVITIAGVIA